MLPQMILAALGPMAGVSRQPQDGGRGPVEVPDYPTAPAGNPFVSGWYADPDTAFYEGRYWVFPTSSYAYEQQTYLDAFSSADLIHWTKHPNILTTQDVKWATKAVWAPAPIARHGKYYLYFGANDIQEDEDADGSVVGGIGVAVSDRPEGPYVDALGAPLIGHYHHGAQPIDQDVFLDDDGQAYIYYGGHGHANVAKLNADMISLGTLDDGTTFREITPANYTEGSQMLKRRGVYYFMWSEGGWGGPDYSVAYARSDSPLGPFDRREARILQQDAAVATGSGHHGVIRVPGTDVYYIVYHRRPLSETDGNHRVLAYDRMYFDEDDGTIAPVRMLVRDNFADGDAIGWKMYGDGDQEPGDKWTVSDQHLVGVVSRGMGFAMLDTNFTDFTFDATVAVSQGRRPERGSGAGLVFRATPDPDGDVNGFQYYYAGMLAAGSVVLETRNKNGTMKTLGEATLSRLPAASSGYTMRVTAVGKVFQVYVDDMDDPILRVTDSALPTGANGVAVFDATGIFGNISVG